MHKADKMRRTGQWQSKQEGRSLKEIIENLIQPFSINMNKKINY